MLILNRQMKIIKKGACDPAKISNIKIRSTGYHTTNLD